MKVYLAHNFLARSMLRAVVHQLKSNYSITVTSRWISDDSHTVTGSAEQSAIADIHDIEDADAVFLFIDQYGERPGRGKWWEFGFAVARGIPVYLIGRDLGCVFSHLPESWGVYRYLELEPAVQGLKQRGVERWAA